MLQIEWEQKDKIEYGTYDKKILTAPSIRICSLSMNLKKGICHFMFSKKIFIGFTLLWGAGQKVWNFILFIFWLRTFLSNITHSIQSEKENNKPNPPLYLQGKACVIDTIEKISCSCSILFSAESCTHNWSWMWAIQVVIGRPTLI